MNRNRLSFNAAMPAAKKRARSKQAAPRIDPRRKSFFDHLDDAPENDTAAAAGEPLSALKSQLGSPTSTARRDASNRRMSTRRSLASHHNTGNNSTTVETSLQHIVPASPFELRHEGAFVFKKRKPLQQQQQQQQQQSKNNKSKQSKQQQQQDETMQDDDAEAEQQTDALQHAKSVAHQLATDDSKDSNNNKAAASYPAPPLVPLYSSSQPNALRLQFSVAPMQQLSHAIQQHYELNLHDEQQKASHLLSSSSSSTTTSDASSRFAYVQHALATVSADFLSTLEQTMHETLLRGGASAPAKDATVAKQETQSAPNSSSSTTNSDGIETLQSRWRHIKEK